MMERWLAVLVLVSSIGCGDISDPALVLGDPVGQSSDAGHYYNGVLWTHTSISVCWETAGNATAAERTWAPNLIEGSWEANSALDFTGWQDCGASGANLRVFFDTSINRGYVKDFGQNLDNVEDGVNVPAGVSAIGTQTP